MTMRPANALLRSDKARVEPFLVLVKFVKFLAGVNFWKFTGFGWRKQC